MRVYARGRISIKLDMAKVYDYVRWDYLDRVLQKIIVKLNMAKAYDRVRLDCLYHVLQKMDSQNIGFS